VLPDCHSIRLCFCHCWEAIVCKNANDVVALVFVVFCVVHPVTICVYHFSHNRESMITFQYMANISENEITYLGETTDETKIIYVRKL